MDAITPLVFEFTPAASRVPAADQTAGLPVAAVFDVARFDAVYAAAGHAAAATPAVPKVSAGESEGLHAVLVTLQGLNGRADSLGASGPLAGAGGSLKPADMLMMTMKAHEFLFHCELTSNVANRTSDGVQQLFREQS
jgi:hypothetical protein